VPRAHFADDQPFRLTSIALVRPTIGDDAQAILSALRDLGANTTVNNLWPLGWFGEYDKLAMTRRIMERVYGVNIDRERDALFSPETR
jgi:hypothetical protein